jgi:hypothetical protein
MCSTPVTLGGGMTIEKAGRSSFSRAANRPSRSQKAYQRCSTARGSYPLSNIFVRITSCSMACLASSGIASCGPEGFLIVDFVAIANYACQ